MDYILFPDLNSDSSHLTLATAPYTQHTSDVLRVEGIVIKIETTLLKARKRGLPETPALSRTCKSSLNVQDEVWSIDGSYQRLTDPVGNAKVHECLLLSFSLLANTVMVKMMLLEWDGSLAHRAGIVELGIPETEIGRLKAANPKLRRFTLG